MTSSPKRLVQNVLRVIGCIIALGYLIFIVDGISSALQYKTPPEESAFGIFMVYVLFAFFLTAFYFMWKNEALSGLLLIIWFAVLLMLVRWIWVAAVPTLILGAPIFLFGVALLIYGLRKRMTGGA